jgi:hypothetical protein
MAAAKRTDGYLEDDDEIFRVDTIPPPDGDDDAYGAATKVGPLAQSKIEEMLKAAEANESMHPPPSAVRRKVEPVIERRTVPVEESDDYEDAELTLEPTSLHAAAPPPAVETCVVAIPPAKEDVAPAQLNLAPPFAFELSAESSHASAGRPSVMKEAMITLAALGVSASALVYWLF